MFWGATLEQGSTLNLSQQAQKGDILHLSHINLNSCDVEGLTSVFVMVDRKKFPLAVLSRAVNAVDVDLYFSTASAAVFSVQGKGQVSLLGYFPPKQR